MLDKDIQGFFADGVSCPTRLKSRSRIPVRLLAEHTSATSRCLPSRERLL